MILVGYKYNKNSKGRTTREREGGQRKLRANLEAARSVQQERCAQCATHQSREVEYGGEVC